MKSKITDTSIRRALSAGEAANITDTQLNGFCARVRKSGSVVFSVIYSPEPYKRVRYTIGSWPGITAAAARDIAQTVLQRVARGEDPQADRVNARADAKEKKLTLREFLRDHYAVRRMKKQINTEDYIGRISNYFAPLLDVALEDISLAQAEKCRSVKLHHASVGTINHAVTLFKAALRLAYEWDLIEPIAWLHKFKKWPEHNTVKPRYLSQQELTNLYNTLDQWESKHEHSFYELYAKPMVLLGLNAGLRRSEALNLKSKNVCFETRIITLNAEDTKGRKARHIPMNSVLFDALKKHSELFPTKREEFFETHYNPDAKWGPNKYYDDNFFSPHWAKIKELAGLPDDFRFHDLRHTFASWLVMTGTDIYSVSSLLGHSSVKQTEIYAHLAPDFKREAVERLTF